MIPPWITGAGMNAVPVLLFFTGTICLGLWLGLEYLRRVRSRPVMIGMHALLGAGGLEVMVMLLRGAPDGSTLPGTSLMRAAALLLLLAMMSGLLAPMIGRRSRRTMNVALAAHVGVAATGFALFLAMMLI